MHGKRKPHWQLLLVCTLFLTLFSALGWFSPADLSYADTAVDPTSVTIAGSLQSELGCPGDWQPECEATHLTYAADDDVWQGVWNVPAGAWEYKATLNNSWDENYGAGAQPGGANILLNLADPADVKFYYDHKSHWITDNVNSRIATVPGSYQAAIGCPGDWQPDCLHSWLQDPDGDGVYTFTTSAIPAGSYEAKVTINESWDENYGQGGAPGGSNIPFTVANAGDETLFSFDSATNVLTIGEPAPPPDLDYAVFHYYRPGGDYEGWGLHLWGEAIDPDEGTQWSEPKLFSGFDDFGAYVAVRLQDPTQPLNFIIHKGDDKDTPNDRSFIPADTPVVWLVQDDATNHGSRAAATGQTVIHYNRPDGDYDGWGLHLWGDAIDPAEATDWATPKPPDGFDDYGAYFVIDLANPDASVNFIVHKGDLKDPDADLSYVPAASYAVWVKAGDTAVYTQKGAAAGFATIHYHRPDGDYGDPTSSDYNDFWGLHLWTGFAGSIDWTDPYRPTGQDSFGIYWEVPLVEGAPLLNYIIHRGDEKDPGPDQALVFADSGYEIWQVTGNGTQFTDPAIALASLAARAGGDLSRQQAYWLTADSIAWPAATDPDAVYQLHYAADAGLALGRDGVTGGSAITLTLDPAGLDAATRAKFPHLATLPTLKIGAADLALVPEILKGQFAVAAVAAGNTLLDATGLQIPGVLDDLYPYAGDLGVTWDGGVPTIRLWAPTAQSVTFHLFADADPATTSTTTPMIWDPATGVWSITGATAWKNQFYLFEVVVFAPTTGRIETNVVTDPYSFSLAMNSTRSQIVDLDDPALKPAGWDTLVKPPATAPEDISVYEIHMRDFSVHDPLVPDAYKGTYMAFTVADSHGVNHLKALQAAGLTHLHLLPVFDIATINENKAEWQEPDPAVLATYPPDSEAQQAAVTAVRDLDGFNWGYDPLHYTVPEGSYSTDPDGVTRIIEFRKMVQALNADIGLRVVMDVVYNHTNASGQSENSVLDRIVPGYYHRLNANGGVENSTCCANTATEHHMMEKLMLDSLVTWATQYKIDAFRFDLMGHHMLSNMLNVRAALDALAPAADGVDGQAIYVYGEGWNFGEVADNARGVNATQANLAGTGIGSFNDRLRDAVRGAGPFAGGQDLLTQGFASGLYYDPNALDQGSPEDQLNRLLLLSDQIRVGMAGNLAGYQFIDRNGALVTGADVDYNGQPTGYTADPQEDITYVSKHDNQTLYDIYVYGLPTTTSMADRVRVQNLGLSTVMLGQGVPFFHAGSDLLRSKSLDRDSYNSGDWFNTLDFTYQMNNFGVGLPVAGVNESNWDVMRPYLADTTLQAGADEITLMAELFQELLQIRASSKLFRLETAVAVQSRVAFHNTGPDQIPGLIVMSISDMVRPDLDPGHELIVVLINANDEAQNFTEEALVGLELTLHPVQAASVDPVVQTTTFDAATGTFAIPARTTAVFVLPQTEAEYTYFFPWIAVGQPAGDPDNDPEDEALAGAVVSYSVQDDVFYFVLTDRFANGDPVNDYGDDPGGDADADVIRHGFRPSDKKFYHGGDLAGLINQLDYLEGLGVSALWITPPFVNKPTQPDSGSALGVGAGYHGYWILDYENADPHLGSNAELQAFIDAAQARGMKVFFDIVVNHTADVISYAEGEFSYRNKEDFPYKDADGAVFDDRDYVGGATFPTLDPAVSFPYTPIFPNPGDETAKNPAWLNNPIYYHNRGDSSFVGENSLYGDFFGLDDLFTEHPDVVAGYIDIFTNLIDEFGIDGFRIDTVKHVNLELWQELGPAVMAHAAAQGKEDFYMFGEVFDGNPVFKSRYTTAGALPSVLDFGFNGQAINFAAGGGATNNLRDFFDLDDYYTDADSNAYGLATFLGNHDIGRFGYFVQNARPAASPAEQLARMRLGHGLLFFARGFPVLYYGDEQGFTGSGGGELARQDMFPSQVAEYNDDVLIDTRATTAVDNFDPTHPLYRGFAAFAALRDEHVALRRGAQIHRYSSPNAGIYAFSRIDRDEQVEYVLAFNNAAGTRRATFPVYLSDGFYAPLYPPTAATLRSAGGRLTVDVPPLSFVIYRATQPLPPSPVAPAISFTTPAAGAEIFGRAEIGAALSTHQFAEVTFAVRQAGESDFTLIGVDNNPPYRVFYDVSDLPLGTELTFKAIVNDLNGHLKSTTVTAVVGEEPTPEAAYAFIHYNRPDGDYDGWGLHLWGDAIDPSEATDWANPKLPNGEDAFGKFWYIKLADPGAPLNFIIHKDDDKDTPDDRSFTPADVLQIWVNQGDATHYPSQAAAQGMTVLHYQRPDGDYDGWGLHLWGDAIDPSEATEWSAPKLPTGFDEYGAYFEILLQDPTKTVNFIVHKGDDKDTADDRSYTPAEKPNVWLRQGDTAVYGHPGAAENFAVIHYHRPAGDYDGWGLHLWAGFDGSVDWNNPFMPTGADAFGVYFQVPLVPGATELAYIIHKGDEKDLPDDQFLNLRTVGYEVWILQSTPGYLLPLMR